MQNAHDQEKLLEKYMEQNNRAAAVEVLFDLIVKSAADKNFIKADQLREKLFEVDPMALDQIVKSAEIIESAKIAAIDPVHRDTWSGLYRPLSAEEQIALYYGMKKANFEAGQIVFRQGQMNANLYFVDAGRLKLFYHRGKQGILLKTIGAGDLAGKDSFFSNSTCTFSMMADSEAKMRFLEKPVLEKWRAEAPGLANKLQGYCAGLESIHDLLQKKELERRAHERYAVSGAAAVHIFTKADKKVSKGDLSDISASGISFVMSTSSKEADALLGRHLKLRLAFDRVFPPLRIDRGGAIVGIHHQMFNDYLINVKWEEPLDNDAMEKIKLMG